LVLSETGGLPPGVADDWLDERLKEDFDARLAGVNQAILGSPDDPALYEEKGAVHLARGRYREASAAFGAAISMDVGRSTAWRGLGDALLRMGRPEANEAHQRAEGMVPAPGTAGPGDRLVRLALEMVPPPVREVACGQCGGRKVSWVDLELFRCLSCGRVGLSPG
jgi:tetratricopeptide (TPR) repeat protein